MTDSNCHSASAAAAWRRRRRMQAAGALTAGWMVTALQASGWADQSSLRAVTRRLLAPTPCPRPRAIAHARVRAHAQPKCSSAACAHTQTPRPARPARSRQTATPPHPPPPYGPVAGAGTGTRLGSDSCRPAGRPAGAVGSGTGSSGRAHSRTCRGPGDEKSPSPRRRPAGGASCVRPFSRLRPAGAAAPPPEPGPDRRARPAWPARGGGVCVCVGGRGRAGGKGCTAMF